jgi:hypothetical protein
MQRCGGELLPDVEEATVGRSDSGDAPLWRCTVADVRRPTARTSSTEELQSGCL